MPSFKAGQRVTASQLNNALGINAYKGSDQSVTSSTTLVNDTALILALSANTTYEVTALIFYTAGTTGDLKGNFTSPAGATSPGVRYIGQTTSLAVQQGVQSLGSAFAFGGNGGTVEEVDLAFTIAIGSTAGNLTFQFAQNATDATATTVKAGSVLRAVQVSP